MTPLRGVNPVPGRRLVLAALLGLMAPLVVAPAAQAAPGSLTFLEQDKNGLGGVSGIDAALDLAIAPDGTSVYVVGSGSSSVATFTRNPTTGALTWLEQDVDGAGGVEGIGIARGVAVSPDGKNVYVTGTLDGAVATFTRDLTTGALTWLEQDVDGAGGVDGLGGAWAVTVAPDGENVYVTGNGDSAVAVFTRDGTTGALTFVEQEKDGVGGVDGLSSATGLAVSPDNADVYVTGCGDSAVAAFGRDPSTGALAFTEVEKQGLGGVDGIACSRGVAVAPNGADVSVVGESSDAVATFTRNPSTGALAFLGAVKDGVGGTDGLDGARDVAYAPDGTSVYVASALDDAVASLNRNTTTGSLTWLELDRDGVNGVDGLDQGVAVGVSADGKNVYASSEADDAVVTFTRDTTAAPAPVPATRSVTLKASKTKVVKGRKVKFSGVVTSTVAACAAGVPVTLRKKVGKKPYKTIANLTSTAAGKYKVKRKVKKKAKYQAVVVATAACGPARSKAVKVKVITP